MDDTPGMSIARRVRTMLARGASGTVEAGMLRRPLSSARVRDDGVVLLMVDIAGMSRDGGDSAGATSPGGSATVEIVDSLCTGRCRSTPPRPSFALDGRSDPADPRCGEECAVTRGMVRISGIVTSSAPSPRRRLVSAADAGDARDDARYAGEIGALRLAELRPLEAVYLSAEGVQVVSRGELAAATPDPIGVDEQEWLRRLAVDDDALALRLASRADLPIAGARPRVIGIDGHGLDVTLGSVPVSFDDVVRVPFPEVCRTASDVERALAGLDGGNLSR